MSPQFICKAFLGLEGGFDKARVAIIGCPMDDTSSFTPGSRFAPNAIREGSVALETYSPSLKADLIDIPFTDMGDLDLPVGGKERALDVIAEAAKGILIKKKLPVAIGGEHLISLPLIRETLHIYPDLKVIHLDAHTDMRDQYLGERFSHATVMRRVIEEIAPKNLYQIGIRSGTREEFELIEKIGCLYGNDKETAVRIRHFIGDAPCYISLDLDILDPGIFPATGTPEPGGMTFNQLTDILYTFKGMTIAGIDIVEYNPLLDPSRHCSVMAAKLIREMILISCSTLN